jgi:sugar/nucleoside kinase (ribokinase family)
MVEVIASGHVCLDLLPAMSSVPLEGMASPGKLFEIGPLDLATGGSVSNTGLTLHRLGVDVGLMGSVGSDMLGRLLIAMLKDTDPTLADYIRVREGKDTSYSVLMSPENSDRIILHSTGANATFTPEDVDFQRVTGAKLFHLGYPPLLPGLLTDDGAPLAEIFQAVKALGVVTSMDTAMPDPLNASGQVNWRAILTNTLPYVDVFVPSVEEIVFMLRRDAYDAVNGDVLPTLDRATLESLTGELLEMGCAVAGLKLSSYGMYLRATADSDRLQPLAQLGLDLSEWADAAVYQPAFKIPVVGTTGAGDAAYGGLLAALLRGLPPARVATVANAVAALNVTQSDATSGLLPWNETLAKIDAGWPTLDQTIPGF